MTYAGWGAFGHGKVVFPLDDTVAADVSLLELADPALAAMLDFLPAVLDLELGAALKQYALRRDIKIARAVISQANAEPVPALYADKTRFPFFALYRKGEQHTGHTTSWDKSVGDWEFAYVLPALMPGPQNDLVPILHAVGRVIGYAVRRGRHPSYGGGAEVLKNAGIMSARLVATRYERYERMNSAAGSNNEQFFRAIVGTLEVVERDATVVGSFDTFTGASISVGQKTPNQANLADVAMTTALPVPTIDSVTPTSGTKAGGTTLNLVGSNFRPGSTLSIGRITVPVTVIDASHATAVTPPHEANPDYMATLTLTDPEGVSVRKVAGFTFTTP